MQRQIDTPADGALAGVRVLEIPSEFTVYGGTLLAELGVDVVLVEPPGGSALRRLGPFYGDGQCPETSLFLLHYNTSKRSVTLDLGSSQARELVRRLVALSDVAFENFTGPWVMERWAWTTTRWCGSTRASSW